MQLQEINKKAAIAAFDKAIALKPDSQQAYTNKGFALQMLDRTKEAEKAFARSKQLKKTIIFLYRYAIREVKFYP